jgi:hypothetical protein
MRTKFHARREVWNNAIAIYFGQKSPDGNFFSAQPPVMVKHEMGTAAEPFLALETEEAQLLMDELWSAGLRPSEGTGSAGSLAATERHLKDMQTIALGLLQGGMRAPSA